VTAAALDLADARPLYRWRDGIEPKEQAAADRLRLLFRIGYEVERAYGPRVLSAFLRSTNRPSDPIAGLSPKVTGE